MASIIIKNCNQCELDIPLKYANKLYKDLTIKHPNAFYLMKRVSNWDGMVHYINKAGIFKIGLLPRVLELCESYGLKVKVIDNRKICQIDGKVPKRVNNYILRPEQYQAVLSVLNNTVGGTPFRIGVIDYTVNAGKSLIMSALYKAFGGKLRTLVLTNDASWLDQSRREFVELVDEKDLTFVQGGKVMKWNRFTIGMVQSISRNIRSYQGELTKIDMVLVDEADLAGSKMYQSVLTHLYNTQVRIGLSGTIYMSKLVRDRVKNLNLETFFGKTLREFRLAESIKKGYSTKTIVKCIHSKPYYYGWESDKDSYQDIYDDTIINNFRSLYMVYHRLLFNIKYDHLPALIVCKFVKHCENLYEYIQKQLDRDFPGKYNINYVHVNTPGKKRKQILEDFRTGKIDILISTTIVARGKNFPLLKLLINAASMDSQEKSIQFLGRLVRTHKSKNKVYLDDIQYEGKYLSRHSRHRKVYYQNEKLKVILLEKLAKKYPKHFDILPF